MPLLEEDVDDRPSRMDGAKMLADVALGLDDDADTPAAAPVAEQPDPKVEKIKASIAKPDVEPAKVADEAVAPPVEGAVPAAVAPEPVSFTALGEVRVIPGATLSETGDVTLPAAFWKEAQLALADGVQWRTNFAQLQRQDENAKRATADAERLRAEADTITSTKQVQFDALVNGLTPILGELMTLVPNAGPAIQKVIYEAQLAASRHELTQMQERGKPTPAQVTQQSHDAVAALLIKDGPGAYPGLFANQAVGNALIQKYAAVADRYITRDEKTGKVTVNVQALDRDLATDARIAAMQAPAPTSRQPQVAAAAASVEAAKKPSPTPSKSVTEQPRGRDGKFKEGDDEDEDDDKTYRQSRRQMRENIRKQVAASVPD